MIKLKILNVMVFVAIVSSPPIWADKVSSSENLSKYEELLRLPSNLLDLEFTEVKKIIAKGGEFETSRTDVIMSRRLNLLRLDLELDSLTKVAGTNVTLTVLYDASLDRAYYSLGNQLVIAPEKETIPYANQFFHAPTIIRDGTKVYKIGEYGRDGFKMIEFLKPASRNGESGWERRIFTAADGVIIWSEFITEQGVTVLSRENLITNRDIPEDEIRHEMDVFFEDKIRIMSMGELYKTYLKNHKSRVAEGK